MQEDITQLAGAHVQLPAAEIMRRCGLVCFFCANQTFRQRKGLGMGRGVRSGPVRGREQVMLVLLNTVVLESKL